MGYEAWVMNSLGIECTNWVYFGDKPVAFSGLVSNESGV